MKLAEAIKTKGTNFYNDNQNNSGGYFIINKDVAEIVIVEANDIKHANERLDKIVGEHSWFCSCCGHRWSGIYDFDEPISLDGDVYFHFRYTLENLFEVEYNENNEHHAVVHFLDGTRKYYGMQS